MTIKSTRVKAHQDENKLPSQVLSDAALQNINVNSIANHYLLDTCQPQPRDKAEHVDAQAVSICYQATYFWVLL